MLLNITKTLLWYTPIQMLKGTAQLLGFLVALLIFLMIGIPQSE